MVCRQWRPVRSTDRNSLVSPRCPPRTYKLANEVALADAFRLPPQRVAAAAVEAQVLIARLAAFADRCGNRGATGAMGLPGGGRADDGVVLEGVPVPVGGGQLDHLQVGVMVLERDGGGRKKSLQPCFKCRASLLFGEQRP